MTSKTDKTETGTHIIYKRHTGPRSFERKEGAFIITRGHRIKIAETPADVQVGDNPVIPAHLAADLVESGVAEYFSAPAKDKEEKPDDGGVVTPVIDGTKKPPVEPKKEG